MSEQIILVDRNVQVSQSFLVLCLKARPNAKAESNIENITSVQKPVNEKSVNKTVSNR